MKKNFADNSTHQTPIAGVKGLTKKHSEVMLAKARKAFDNAKHRCKYNLPGYETVQFAFDSFKEFLADVGLPANEAMSLDRIDPHGHYAPGNVHWTNKYVQAVNKKKSSKGLTQSVAQMVAQAGYAAGLELARQQAPALWAGTIAWHTRGMLSNELQEYLAVRNLTTRSLSSHSVNDSSFPTDLEQIFLLSSLTRPGRLVRIAGRPSRPLQIPPRLTGDGLRHLVGQELVESFTKNLTVQGKSGIAWVCRPPTDAILNAGGLELQMLALAGRLCAIEKFAKLTPALEAFAHHSAYGYGALPPALSAMHLFIPDFQIELDADVYTPSHELRALLDVVEVRGSRGLWTHIGIQSPTRIPRDIRNRLFSILNVEEFSLGGKSELPDVETVREARAWQLAKFLNDRDEFRPDLKFPMSKMIEHMPSVPWTSYLPT